MTHARATIQRLVAITLFAAAVGATSAAQAADPRGRWITSGGNAEVEVADCGAALCGTIRQVFANRSMTPGGGEMRPADGRSPLGLQVMTGFVPTDFDAGGSQPAEWAGTVYNRETGRHHPCRISIDGDTLLLRIQAGPLMNVTQRWTRAETTAAAAAGAAIGTDTGGAQ